MASISNKDTSANRIIIRLGSAVRISLTLAKALLYASSHIHAFPFIRSCLSGCIVSASRGANLLSWFAIPKKRRTSPTFAGTGTLRTADTLLGSGRTYASAVNDVTEEFD